MLCRRRFREGVGMVRSDVVDIHDAAAVAQFALEAGQGQLARPRRLPFDVRRLQAASQTQPRSTNTRAGGSSLNTRHRTRRPFDGSR